MPKTVVIADDSATIRKAFELTFMNMEEVILHTTATVDETLNAVKKLKPDLVIADSRIGDVTGYELCRKIKEGSSVAVWIMTGPFERLDDQQYIACGAEGHVRKPFDTAKMIGKVLALSAPPEEEKARPSYPAATAAAPASPLKPVTVRPPLPVGAGPQPAIKPTTTTPEGGGLDPRSAALVPPAAGSASAVAKIPAMPVSAKPDSQTVSQLPPAVSPATPLKGPRYATLLGTPLAPPIKPSPPGAAPAPPEGGHVAFAGPSHPTVPVPAAAKPQSVAQAAPLAPAEAKPQQPVAQAATLAPAAAKPAPATQATLPVPVGTPHPQVPHPPAGTSQPRATEGLEAVTLRKKVEETIGDIDLKKTYQDFLAALAPQQQEQFMGIIRDVVERVAWEVVPEIAEAIIKEELDRLLKE